MIFLFLIIFKIKAKHIHIISKMKYKYHLLKSINISLYFFIIIVFLYITINIVYTIPSLLVLFISFYLNGNWFVFLTIIRNYKNATWKYTILRSFESWMYYISPW